MRKLRKVTVHEVIQNPAIDHEVNYVSAQLSSIPDDFIILYISHADYKVISFSLCTNVLMLTEGSEKSGWCKNALCWKGTVIHTHTHTHAQVTTGLDWSGPQVLLGLTAASFAYICILSDNVRELELTQNQREREREAEKCC